MEEAEDAQFGAVLRGRSMALRSSMGLGPPDLCYVHKEYKAPLGLGGLSVFGMKLSDDRTVGFYHHVLGLDVSSPAPISAYVADLARAAR